MQRSLLVVMLLALPFYGGERSIVKNEKAPAVSAKAAWEWTIEERLRARFDPVATKARVDAAFAVRAAERSEREAIIAHGGISSGRRPADAIRGSVHPELLMPHEIFDTFVGAAFRYEDDVAQEFRRDAAAKANALGLSADFLDVLQEEAHEFIELQRREQELRDEMSGGARDSASLLAEIKRLEAAQCPVRANAIARLRAKFGAVKVNHFLYSAIAPGVYYDFEEPQNAQVLRSREEGCP